MKAKLFPGSTLCVILHYGSESDTNNCISSLRNENDLDIVVSDNDPSQSYALPTELKGFASVIRTGGSAGFSEGNNIAVNAFLSTGHCAVLVLNNDTIVTTGALDFLRNSLEADGVGAVGPCMPFADYPTKVWACGGTVNTIKLSVGGMQPISQKPYQVDYLPGAAILCRADLWRQIGGFNEAYFLAYEEVELCLNIKKLGFKIIADPRSVILHKVGMSGQRKPEYFYNSIRNRLIFAKYLYGNLYGFIHGVTMTLLSQRPWRIKSMYRTFPLWRYAVIDHVKGVPISRKKLQAIAREFGDFK